MKFLARLILIHIWGWKFVGDFPKLDKYVIIAGPHTSWVDFPVGILAKYARGAQINYVGKASLFKPPHGFLFRLLGGAPVDRSKNTNVVQSIVDIFNSRDRFILALAPEGTRKKVTEFKTGFYYIAKGANVPIVIAVLDFGNKQIRISEPYYTTNNKEVDFEYFYSHYRGVEGFRPDLSF